MDDGKVDLNPDLTSSIGDVLLSTKNDKTDANDSTPTSSTDAASSFSGASLNVSEDPISSTSSDVMEKDKLIPVTKTEDAIVSKNLLGTEGDVDLLDMNIANVSSEPINEDVEDIVQDLENLLGEPEPQHDFPTRRKDKSPSEERQLIASLDATPDEKDESAIIPETSETQSSENDETDNVIQPKSSIDQITITEKASNTDADCSIHESEELPEKQKSPDVMPVDKDDCGGKLQLEKTEDISCKSVDLHVATPDKSEEITETETIQKEDPTEIVDAEVNEIHVVPTVTSTEGTDDKGEQEESSDLTEVNLINSNDFKEVEVEEVEQVRSSEISQDQESCVPVETENQGLVTDDSNTVGSCDTQNKESCEILESKAELEPEIPKSDLASKDDHTVDAAKEIDASKEQLAVSESENQASSIEEQSSASELENQESASEEQLSILELKKQVDEDINQGEVVETTDLPMSTEQQQLPNADSIQDPSEFRDSEDTCAEVLPVSEKIQTEETPLDDDLPKDSNPLLSEAVEHADQELGAKNIPDGTSVSDMETEVEFDRNVTSSSDLASNQGCKVENPIISDCDIIKNLGDNSETHPGEPTEIFESIEPNLAVAEESNISSPVGPNFEYVEETNNINETCKDKMKSPLSEISSTEDQETGIDTVTVEETVVITDSTTSEENSEKDEQIPEETVVISDSTISEENSTKDEEMPEDTVIITDSTISEENSAKYEEIPEETVSRKDEEIPEKTTSSDDSSKSEDFLTKEKDNNDRFEDEEIPEKTTSSDDSSKSEDYLTEEKDNNDRFVEEKSDSLPKDTILEQNIIPGSPIAKEESLETNIIAETDDKVEQNLKLDSPATNFIEERTEEPIESTPEEKEAIEVETQKDKSESIEDKSATVEENESKVQIIETQDDPTPENKNIVDIPIINKDVVEDQAEQPELSPIENIEATSSKDEPSDTGACGDENKVEIVEEINFHPIEDMVAEKPPEHQGVKENPTEENILQTEEEIIQNVADQRESSRPSSSPEDYEQLEEDCVIELNPVTSEETEKQDEEGTQAETPSVENKVMEENMDQDNAEVLEEVVEEKEVYCSGTTLEEAAIVKKLEAEIIPEIVEADPECIIKESHSENSSNDQDSPELPRVSDDLKTVDIENTLEEPCLNTNQATMDNEIDGNLDSAELAEDKMEDLQKSEKNEELIPVKEELCIKKVIIYEHDCDSHNTNESKPTTNEKTLEKSDFSVTATINDTANAESSDLTCIKTEEVIEHVTYGESEDDIAPKTEKKVSEEDLCMVDSSIASGIKEQTLDESNESSIIPEISQTAKIEETIAEVEENELNEQTSEQDDEQIVKESNTFAENISCSQREEVTSSDQHDGQVEIITSGSGYPDESKVIGQSISEILEKNEEEENQVEQIMEDQTTAAVQSILNNMLTEEKSIERVIEKEDPPVVHSSYSSYEVQKAVQEIQGITVEAVEISSEAMECISSSEKLQGSEKLQFDNENCPEMNVSSQSKVVETQISQIEQSDDLIISKSEEAIGILESYTSEEVFDEKVHQVQEIVDSPLSNTEDQNVITQSDYEPSEDNKSKLPSTEEHSMSPSVAKSSGASHVNDPVVIPSIDLSEESSSDEESDEDKKQNVVSSSVSSTSVIKEPQSDTEDKESEVVTVRHVPKVEKFSGNTPSRSEPKRYSPRETRHSSRISERTKPYSSKEDINQPLSVNIEEIERDKPYSPKITIKPIREDEPHEDKEEHKGSLKITITKQSDNTHSILKMCSPDVEHRQKQSENEDQNIVPKLVIKTSDTHTDQHSPKMSTRSSKQVLPNSNIRSGSPRITIKPIIKPDNKETITSPLKITIKPIGKPEEFSRQQQRHSPKQLKNKTDDDHYSTRSKMTKSSENSDVHSPKVTIKPVKPPEEVEVVSTPKITIKPIEKPEEARVSPKITIKPVLRPVELETEVEDEVKERIVLKINKGNLPVKDTERIGRESRKREHEDDKSEKLAKIKLKFSKDGDAHIVHKKDTEMQPSNKRQQDFETERTKRFKAEETDSDEDVKLIETTQSPIVISEDSQSQDSVILIEEAKDPLAEVATPEPKPQVTPVSAPRKRGRPRKVPLVVREDFGNEQKEKSTQATSTPVPVPVPSTNQPAETETTGRPKRSCRAQSVRDTLGIKPRKPSKPRGGKRGAGVKSFSMKPDKGPEFSEEKINAIKKSLLTEEALQDAHSSGILKVSEILPKKLESKIEEPTKPLGLKSLLEAAKDQNIIEVIEIDTPSNSPKCLETVEIDKIEEEEEGIVIEEKPVENIIDSEKDLIGETEKIIEIKNFEIQKEVLDLREDGDCNKESSDFCATDAAASDVEMQPPTPVFAPPLSEASAVDISSTTDIAMFEEETRMSADVSSRAQTPAKQVVSADVVVEESQSSMQSTATTESGKISRRSRLEVHQDQDGSVFTADQLNEYYWGGNGPFMIQEQVAQYLGIKSFKRKYPGIPRRMVDMQERDYIRENGLASESMCDLGLTAVNSADILDIMYTDFQEKYEEFCRYQREKQAKDLLNKQKALSVATNQEKSKLDILEQAVQSAAAYNANFNKTRREQRRACMDLQTMNIHYPKGKLKKISMPKIGNYPVAVVPGQFTDYYKEFTPTELNNLPLNTMLYTELHKILPDISDSESESSGSDSDDSSSSGSDSNSSCEDNCKMCDKGNVTPRKSPVNSSI